MAIYIDADVLLRYLGELRRDPAYETCKGIIRHMPSADVEPARRWIPVEERLPENGVPVLVWYEYFRFGNYNRLYQTYGIGYHYDGCWSMIGQQVRCIAWMPLPKPYAEGDKE